MSSFEWVYIFFSAGQVLLLALSWCSACTSESEAVLLMHPWRETYPTSTNSSATLFLPLSLLYGSALMAVHDSWKHHSFDYRHLCQQSNLCLLFHMLSRFVIAVLPRSKPLFTSWLLWPTAVILEPKKINSFTVSIVSSSVCMRWWYWMPWS